MRVGFARLEITPPLGTDMAGTFHFRPVSGIITPIYVNAIVFEDEGQKAVLITLDLEGMVRANCNYLREYIAEKNAIDPESILIHCTHNHLGPKNGCFDDPSKCSAYDQVMIAKISDAVTFAFEDLETSGEAKAYIARSTAEGLSFVRTYLMTDGEIASNPPKERFDEIVKPIGEPDDSVQLLKITREGAADIAVVNFQTHPDVIGGSKTCYDWPGFVREYLEKVMEDMAEGKGVHAVCINGAQGETNNRDINHLNHSGLDHSRHMARVISGKVMGIYLYTEPINFSGICYRQAPVPAKTSKTTPAEIEMAKKVMEINAAGGYLAGIRALEEGTIDFGIEIANKFIRLEHAPEEMNLYVSALSVGDVLFVGFPGEPFTEVGRQTKSNSPYAMTMIACCGNGKEGYFPTENIYKLGGYEANTANFQAGTAEKLMHAAITLSSDLYKNRGNK